MTTSEEKPNPAFFDAQLYRQLKEHIIESMQHDEPHSSSDTGSSAQCLFCGVWEEYTLTGWNVLHDKDCRGLKFIKLCDEALAILS